MMSILWLPAVADNSNHQKIGLLVGVSRYPGLGATYQLRGPENDVALVRKILVNRDFKVTALGTDGAKPATRAAIIDSLRQIGSIVNRGDFVFLLFAGHGSQQPEGALRGYPPKPDGQDELFLPADVGQWDGNAGTVSNAIVDHEMGSLLNAIRNQGAFVWAVYDSCHSATMSRGAPMAAERQRRILPSVLGIPAAFSRTPSVPDGRRANSLVEPVQLLPNAGGLISFYAAQTTESTPELELPQDQSGRVIHGLFTYALAQSIQTAPGASYRQLAQSILQLYAGMNRIAPTPFFEGDLSQVAFSESRQRTPLRQWHVENSKSGVGMTVSAGYLNQLGSGALLFVLPSPGASDSEAIGVIRVKSAFELTAEAEWVSDADTLRTVGRAVPATPSPTSLPKGTFARLAVLRLPFEVRIARPVACREESWTATNPLCEVATGIESEQSERFVNGLIDYASTQTNFRVVPVDESESAEIHPILYKHRVWLASASGEVVSDGASATFSFALPVTSAPSIEEQHMLNDDFVDALGRIARATNLSRAGNIIGQASVGLDVQMSLVASAGRNQTVLGSDVPKLLSGQQVTFTLVNHGAKPIDVTMLDIGPRYGVDPVFPDSGESNRLFPGSTVTVPGVVDTTDGAGRETMLIVATEAIRGGERTDLSDLAQPPLQGLRGKPPSSAIPSLLWDAAFGTGDGTRGLRRIEAPSAQINRFSWNTAEGGD